MLGIKKEQECGVDLSTGWSISPRSLLYIVWYYKHLSYKHHYVEELEHKPPQVMMWAALNARHIIGSYFFMVMLIKLHT